MNNGLKCLRNQLQKQLAGSTFNVNLNKNEANLVIEIPILKTTKLAPFDVSLIYNHLDLGINYGFGKGTRINYYTELIEGNGQITVKKADGSTYVFILDESSDSIIYKNEELQMKIIKYLKLNVDIDLYEKNEYYYDLVDKYNNISKYSSNNLLYPIKITLSNKEELELDFDSDIKTIKNNHGDVIKIEISQYGYATFTYYRVSNSTKIQISRVDIGLSEIDELNFIDYYINDNLYKTLTLEFEENKVFAMHDEEFNSIEFNFVDGKVNSIKDKFKDIEERATTIDYYDYKTIITNYKGEKELMYFNYDNKYSYSLNNENYVSGINYHKDTQLPTETFGPLYLGTNDDNLLRNININNFTNEGLTITKVNSTDNDLSSLINSKLYKVEGTGVLSYSLDIDGLDRDNITFGIWFKQLAVFSDEKYVKIKVVSYETEVVTINANEITNNYQYISLLRKTSGPFKNIDIDIELYGNASIELGEMTLIKENLGSFYEYDEYDNVLNANFNNLTASYIYNENNKVVEETDKQSMSVSKEYNDNNLTSTEKTYYDVKVENVYDDNKVLIEKEVKSGISVKKFKSKRDYEISSEHIETLYDELQRELMTNKYDFVDRIIESVDYLNTKTEYSYSEKNNLIEMKVSNGDNSSNIVYSYDTYNRLHKITLSNGTIYEFSYNNFDKVNSIKVNNQLIISYIYDNVTGDLLTKKYANKDYYRFTYNEFNYPDKVYYINSDGDEVLKYSYIYNNKNELIKITDSINTSLEEYEYDLKGNIIKVTGSNYSIIYTYDNKGNVNNIYRTYEDRQLHQSFDTVERSKGANPESLEKFVSDNKEYLTCLFKDNYNVINGLIGLAPCNFEGEEQISFTEEKDGIIPCIYLNDQKRLRYLIDLNMKYPDESGAVGFWFKPTDVTSKSYLFSSKGTGDTSFLGVYIENSKLYLEAVDSEGVSKIIRSSSKSVKNNEWNFFALDYMNRNDGPAYADICEYQLTLNSEYLSYEQVNPRLSLSVGSRPLFNIGHKFDGASSTSFFTGKVTCLFVGPNGFVHRSSIKEFYRATKDYLIDNQFIDDDVKAVDFAVARTHIYDEDIINDFDIIHLNNSVVSLKGIKPVEFNVRSGSKYDKDRTFNFNKSLKDYAYVADGTPLKYNFEFDNTGSIALKVYVEGNDYTQYLLEGTDETGNKFGLYLKGSSLMWKIENIVYYTALDLVNDEWNYIGISLRKTLASDSITPVLIVNTFVNDEEHSFTIENSNLDVTTLTVAIGSKLDKYILRSYLGDSETYLPLLGMIEWVAIDDTYVLTLEKFTSLCGNLKAYKKLTMYDEFSLPQRIETSVDNNVGITNDLEYKHQNNYYTTQVSKEIIKGNGAVIATRAYDYDRFGKITKITDSVFGNHEYEYDYRGFLIRDNETLYSYDKNGNIIQKGDVVYTYDSVIKDRLNQCGTTNLTYDSNNKFYLSSDGENIYTYEGKRLASITQVSTSNVISFKYNNKGLRTEKSSANGRTFSYEYSGDKLITEVCDYYRNDFLYDQNGMLYGFVHNMSIVYFYVRDILGNILGITLQSGEIVVKYEYDAYGKLLSTTGPLASLIGLRNPFRYKGYYYDVETNLFLVSSRYYSPELCRWISPDDIEYLDPESVNGLNLYCYCFNDPINYIDPDGHFPILALVLTGIALVGMGLTGIGVATDNNVLTAVGLGMVGTAALVSGIGALVSGVLFTGVVGGITTVAGVGALTFMSAEITEAAGAGNWIQYVTGWSDSTYNTILLSTAAVATLGTAASSFASYYKVSGIRKYDDYLGIKFQNRSGKTRVLSFHTHGHEVKTGLKSIKEWHWQIKKWNPMTKKTSGDVASYIWWNLRKIVW